MTGKMATKFQIQKMNKLVKECIEHVYIKLKIKSPVSMGAVGKKRGVPIFKHDAFALKPLMRKNQDFYLQLLPGTGRHNLNFKNLASFPDLKINKNSAVSSRAKRGWGKRGCSNNFGGYCTFFPRQLPFLFHLCFPKDCLAIMKQTSARQ